ncbi:30S ribosomal protein S16 [Nocardioides sp. NBC_00368]|uniref:30S ribosomal protein S16 n=1 Tax=Nocardioides sp. NBC_00368 TaxID=2976000 RepID=UPI002E1F87DC
MAVKIRLKRLGKIRVPQYRIVIVDSRKKRDGAVIEEIGLYRPKEEPSFIQVDSERAQYWLGVGAQPTPALEAILKVTGDWQKFKGLPGAEGTLKVAPPKPDKLELFNKALAEAHASAGSEAVTKKAAKKAEEPKAEEAPAEEPKAEAASTDEAQAAEAEA